MRFLFLALLGFMAVTAYAQEPVIKTGPLSADPRAAQLKAAVERVYAATLEKQDFDKIADATHSKIIELAGGREKFKNAMKQITDFTKTQFKSVSWTVAVPAEMVESDGNVFGVVPRTLDGVTRTKHRVVQTGAIVGISKDGGRTWKFVDGTNFGRLFPEYAGAIQIPKQRSYINGVEQ